MLQFLIDYAVPVSLFLLMLIAGTDVSAASVSKMIKAPRAFILGTVGQLMALPAIALLITKFVAPAPIIATSTLLLALCPGGGISNYYCYLARCNVLLSATITALGTLLSLMTIPAFLRLLLPAMPMPDGFAPIAATPVIPILVQLLALMLLPMLIGALWKHKFPAVVERAGRRLRALSSVLLLVILLLAVWSTRATIQALLLEILVSVALFILCAMLLGWLLGRGLRDQDQPVLVIEAGTRNIGVSLLIGGTILSPDDFAIFASFLTIYFAVEVVAMVTFARTHARRSLAWSQVPGA